jgi:hypothetical protein
MSVSRGKMGEGNEWSDQQERQWSTRKTEDKISIVYWDCNDW